jgi:chloramphenicol-sensitive protein RarD
MNSPSLQAEARAGLLAAGGAYFLWGVLPLYLKQVAFASAWEVLALRVLWSAPCALAAMFVMRSAQETLSAMKDKDVLRALFLSSFVIAINWGLYVWAVANDKVMEASLAYFLTPLVNVAFGVVLFSERLSRLQQLALALAAAGVVLQGVALAALPWVALILCATWSTYGLIRKQAPVPAAGGLLVETVLLAAPAALMLAWVAHSAPLATSQSGANFWLLALAGPATALPLVLFAFGARRLPFSTLGLLQYIAPTLQFLVGLAYGELFTPMRAASFALIWFALAIFTFDAINKERQRVADSN